MAKNIKTWQDKLNEPRTEKVKTIEFDFAGIPAGSRMLISTTVKIAEYINSIPVGTSVDPETMRKDLALDAGADHTCPVTTGIFLKIIAEAALEKYDQTHATRGLTPFWRVISPDSTLAKNSAAGPNLSG